MKKLFLVFFIFLNLFASNEQIKLQANQKSQDQLNKKLEDLASDILNGEKNLKILSSQIQSLSLQSAQLEQNAKAQIQTLNTLTSQNTQLLKAKAQTQNKLINLIAKDFSYDLALPQGYIESQESFVVLEILSTLNKILNQDFVQLSKDYENINKQIEDKQIQIKQINSNLSSYTAKLKDLQNLKQSQIAAIEKQKNTKNIYLNKLKDLKEQQNELRQTLNQLKIIDKEPEPNSKLAIRQLGTSYQGSTVKKYTGKKTIAPLDSFTVKQKFGNYIDPVYNIKIFNENVVLKSNKSDAVVKNVLDGKIVFAKNTSMLSNVVILEHENGIHTIYAHLDKIAPNIKVGKNVKKGAIIGRIKDDLTFEVTQKNFHINPLELISLN